MKQIATKLHNIMKDVGYIQKKSRNKAQGYTFVSEADTVTMVREAMIKHGVVAIPKVTTFEVAPAGQTKNGSPIFLTTILIEYTFVDMDSGESLLGAAIGQGTDFGDKGAYMAMTGANKYMLWKCLQIATGDDPEADKKEESVGTSQPPAENPKNEVVDKNSIFAKLVELEAIKYPNMKVRYNARQKWLGVDQFSKLDLNNQQDKDKLNAYWKHCEDA